VLQKKKRRVSALGNDFEDFMAFNQSSADKEDEEDIVDNETKEELLGSFYRMVKPVIKAMIDRLKGEGTALLTTYGSSTSCGRERIECAEALS
jgi:hypothetical protein